MPEISLFYGVRITMFYSDHNAYAGPKRHLDRWWSYTLTA